MFPLVVQHEAANILAQLNVSPGLHLLVVQREAVNILAQLNVSPGMHLLAVEREVGNKLAQLNFVYRFAPFSSRARGS